MKLFKKRNLAYYLFLFGVFTLVFFLVNILFSHHELRYSIINGVVSGVVFTILWWFLDQGHVQIKSSAKEDEDEAERKRKE